MAVSIDRDSKILGVLDLIKDAASGVHQNPWDNIRDKVGGLLYNTLVEPQEYQTPVFDTGQTQQFADTHNAMLPERGSKQSMLLPFGYDAQGNIEPAIPSLVRDVGLGAFGLLGEYEKAQTGTGYQDVRDITGQEAANVSQGMLEVMTGGLLDNAPKTFTSGMKRSGGVLNTDIDDLGFYSPTERLAANLQPKGTGEQYLGILSKGDGKGSRIQEEMQDMGLDTWLQNKGKVSRDEVLDYIGENRLRYGEEVLTSKNPYPYRTGDEWQNAVMQANRRRDFDEVERLTSAWESSEGYGFAGDTRHQKYSQTGGTGYQENLLIVPRKQVSEKEARGILGAADDAPPLSKSDINYATHKKYGGVYTSPPSHYDQSNIGLTTRTQSFNTPQGDSVHLMDELQSDWHKTGKKKGYRDAATQKPMLDWEAKNKQLYDENKRLSNAIENNVLRYELEPDPIKAELLRNEALKNNSIILQKKDAIIKEIEAMGERPLGGQVPNAPAKQSWMNQGIKKEINQTIADGRDYFAWTGGDIQADRYDLSKHVDKIDYVRNQDGTFNVVPSQGGQTIYAVQLENATIEKVESTFGKDIAKQMADEEIPVAYGFPIAQTKIKTIAGQDLKVGGEGMKSFYDKDVKKRTEKIIKRLDPNAKVEVIELDNGNKVWGVKITDKMRDKVKSEGMPLYSIAPIAGAGLLGAGMMRQEEQQPQQGILN